MSEVPLTPTDTEPPRTSFTQSSAMRDSVITYSTDVVGSSIAGSRANTFSSRPKADDTPFYRRKRFWVICAIVNIILTAIFIPLFIFVIFPAIAQSAINGSNLNIHNINLTNLQEDSATISSDGNVTNTGPFSSTISFDEPVSMFYNGQEMARVNFDPIEATNGYADLLLISKKLTIIDKDLFASFSLAAFVYNNVTMSFKGTARVKAIGIKSGNLKLEKEIKLTGANNFPDVKLISLNITQDLQGLLIKHVAQLNNPSIFSVDMGKYSAQVSYNGTTVADMTVDDFNLQPGINNISMYGYAALPNSVQDLINIGEVMSAFISNIPITTQAKGLYAYPDNVTSVSWLTSVITNLTLNAVIGNSSDGPKKVITGLDLGQVNVNFVAQPDYSPLFSAKNVVASYKLPFDITSKVLTVSQRITLLTEDGQAFANHTTSTINVTSDNGTAIIIDIPPNALSVIPGENELYQEFFANLTKADQRVVNLTGEVDILANTIIGNIPINRIAFNSSTTLQGFSSFSKIAPIINNVTILSATKDFMVLGINATIQDTSNTSITIGTTRFKIFSGSVEIGSTEGNLSLVPGPNNITLKSFMDPNNSPAAYQILTNFMSNNISSISVSGYDNSTDFESLKLAFEGLTMNTTLPPLSSPLINTANLHILDTTPKDGIAQANVKMTNPFVAGFTIQSMQSNVTADGLALATVSQPNSNINLLGDSSTTTTIPITLNLEPSVLFDLLRQEAISKNINTDVIDTLISIGKIPVPGAPSIDVTKINPDIFDNFDVVKFTESVMSVINTKMDILSTVLIDGQYQITIPISQNVTSSMDDSIVTLVKYLSQPIVESLVNASNVGFSSVLILNPTETGFTAVINGEISGDVPIDAQIATPNGISLVFNGATLGHMNLPDINLVGGVAKLDNVKSQFTISDKDALTKFTGQLLQADKISWTIDSPDITVTALKLAIPGIPFNKNIQLNGANGFKDAVKINNLLLPSDAHEGGIATLINATLANPSTVGVQLGDLSLDVISNNIKIGEVVAKDFTLQPNAKSKLSLTGRLIPQSGDGLKVIEKIFNEFLASQEIPLSTKGTGINPSISWIVPSIESLTIDTVLPSQKIPDLIKDIILDELTLDFTPATAYDPDSSSKHITASIKMPFGFSLSVQKIAQEITIVSDNVKVAKLSIPISPATSNIVNGAGPVIVSYEHIPLQVFDDAHDSFNSFVKALTIQDSIEFSFQGNTTAQTLTPVGIITLDSIPVNVNSKLAGFQGFNSKITPVTSMDVTSGTKNALTIPITTTLFNPTNTTTGVGDVQFDFSFKNKKLGIASIKDLTLAPGFNNVSSIVTFAPEPDALPAGIEMFSGFIGNKTQETVISGSADSTQVDSLKEAFAAIKMNKILPGLATPLMGSTSISLTPDTLKTKIGHANFTFNNPFTVDIQLFSIVNGSVTFHGLLLGTINVPELPNGIIFKGKSSTPSPIIPIILNLDPATLAKIIVLAASDAHIDISPLIPFLPTPPPPPKSASLNSSSNDTDIKGLILKILQSMKVDISIEQSSTMLEDFGPFNLALNFEKVSVQVDQSILLLMQVLAGPAAQAIIDKSEITMKTTAISNEKSDNFKIHTTGEITDIKPIKTTISYPSGLDVIYKSKKVGVLTLPPMNSDGKDTSLNIDNDGAFEITNIADFVQFSIDSLLLPKLSFTISTNNLTVEVPDIGITAQNLNMSKVINVDGLNGLKDVTLAGFTFVGGTITITSNMTNPSNIGFTMDKLTFNLTADPGFIGLLVANNVTIVPKKTIQVQFTLSADNTGLANLFKLIALGKGTLIIKGVSVEPDVVWLSVPITHYEVKLPFTGLPKGSEKTFTQAIIASGKLSAEQISSLGVDVNQTQSQ